MGFERLAGVILCVAAAGETLRRGYAEVLFAWPTRARLERAVTLDGGNAFYHLALGRWREEEGEDGRENYREALKRLEADAQLWVRLALAEEIAGEVEEAERLLREAVKRSKKYDVRWALVNFYFRQGRQAEFVRWGREALAVAWGDMSPLFELAWEGLGGDGGRIRSELLGERRRNWLGYAGWAAGRGRWEEAQRAAAQVGAPRTEEERRALAKLAEQMAGGAREDGASAIWEALGRQGVAAFEWQGVEERGVRVTALEPGRRYRVELSGDQAERCQLLTRLYGRGTRRLRWRAAELGAGFYWEAERQGRRRRAAWKQGEMELEEEGAGRISLVYERPRGEVRFEGRVAVEGLELE